MDLERSLEVVSDFVREVTQLRISELLQQVATSAQGGSNPSNDEMFKSHVKTLLGALDSAPCADQDLTDT